MLNIILWILQIVIGLLFLSIGVIHFILPTCLPAQMAWMHDLSPGLHLFSGAAEFLAGLGLILPGLTAYYLPSSYFINIEQCHKSSRGYDADTLMIANTQQMIILCNDISRPP